MRRTNIGEQNLCLLASAVSVPVYVAGGAVVDQRGPGRGGRAAQLEVDPGARQRAGLIVREVRGRQLKMIFTGREVDAVRTVRWRLEDERVVAGTTEERIRAPASPNSKSLPLSP